MALDEAWYGWLREQLATTTTGGWTRDTTKAWNLRLDLELRPTLCLGLEFPHGTEAVLEHLRAPPLAGTPGVVLLLQGAAAAATSDYAQY